ncbi:putative cytochrome-c oxidase [Helianthus annuus]|nr:putative cytochrome-c oxidase [Helianthus annuus]KAJ0892397.1 putative cytochrome-c oxidase [Helianthus annuus]
MYYWCLFTCIFHFRLHTLTSNHLHLKNLTKFSPARRSNSWKLGLNPSMAKFNNVKSLEEHYLLKDPVKPKEASEITEHENTRAKKPEIKLETAPADYRFPTTNQSRHCFSRYVEYHRCVAAKGEGAPECDKFAKYYRSLCPGEWVDRWNEQRENGTFPGPL